MPASDPTDDSDADTDDIPGTIDILISNSPEQRVGALTFAQSTSTVNSSYVLDVSNNTTPTMFLLHPEDSAPIVPDHPDWTPVSLRVPLNSSSSPNETYCAEFISQAGSRSPVIVKPCMPNWDISANGSQLFVYDTTTSQLSPFWTSLMNGTANSATSAAMGPTSFAATPPPDFEPSSNDGSNLMPATLLFRPNSPSAASSHVTFTSNPPTDAAGSNKVPTMPSTAGSQDDENDVADDDKDNDDDGGDGMKEDDQEKYDKPVKLDPPASAAPPASPLTTLDDDPPAPDPPPVDDPAAADRTPAPAPADSPDPSAPCTNDDNACIGDQFAQCADNVWVLTTCSPGTVCRVVGLWQTSGTIALCDTPDDADFRNSPEGHRRRGSDVRIWGRKRERQGSVTDGRRNGA